MAFNPHDYYVTGFSNILSQPEFFEPMKLRNLSLVFDNLEIITEKLFVDLKENSDIFIANDEYSEHLSVMRNSFADGVISILGSTRMNYKQNLGLINYFKSKI